MARVGKLLNFCHLQGSWPMVINTRDISFFFLTSSTCSPPLIRHMSVCHIILTHFMLYPHQILWLFIPLLSKESFVNWWPTPPPCAPSCHPSRPPPSRRQLTHHHIVYSQVRNVLGNTSQKKNRFLSGIARKGWGEVLARIFYPFFPTMLSLIFWHQYHVMWSLS